MQNHILLVAHINEIAIVCKTMRKTKKGSELEKCIIVVAKTIYSFM